MMNMLSAISNTHNSAPVIQVTLGSKRSLPNQDIAFSTLNNLEAQELDNFFFILAIGRIALFAMNLNYLWKKKYKINHR